MQVDINIVIVGAVMAAGALGFSIYAFWRLQRFMQQQSLEPETHALLRQHPNPRRLAKPTCEGCAHFDLEEGQAQMRAHPVFMQAAAQVSPQQMSRKVKVDDRGNPLYNIRGDVEREEPTVQAKVAWEQFGECRVHNEGRHLGDTCERYEARALS